MKNYFIIIIILTADDKRNETALDTSDIRINLNNTKLQISNVVTSGVSRISFRGGGSKIFWKSGGICMAKPRVC